MGALPRWVFAFERQFLSVISNCAVPIILRRGRADGSMYANARNTELLGLVLMPAEECCLAKFASSFDGFSLGVSIVCSLGGTRAVAVLWICGRPATRGARLAIFGGSSAQSADFSTHRGACCVIPVAYVPEVVLPVRWRKGGAANWAVDRWRFQGCISSVS